MGPSTGRAAQSTWPGRLPELDRAAGFPGRRPRRRALHGADQLHRHLGGAQLRGRDPHAALQGRHPGQPPRIRGPAERRCGQVCRGRPGARAGAAGGSDGRPGRRPARLAARRSLHLRQLCRRQAQRTCPCCGAASRRGRAGHLQPALPLRGRGPRQDAPHARDRLGGAPTQPRGAGTLSLGRAVHVSLRLGAALQGDARVQGDVPLGRHADGRRRAVHLGQGLRPRRSSSTPSTR